MRALLVPPPVLVTGCSKPVERVHGGNGNAVIADLKRIEETLPPEEAAGFAKAYRVLLGVTVVEHQVDWQ